MNFMNDTISPPSHYNVCVKSSLMPKLPIFLPSHLEAGDTGFNMSMILIKQTKQE